mgnify:CR=1 FL=1
MAIRDYLFLAGAALGGLAFTVTALALVMAAGSLL